MQWYKRKVKLFCPYCKFEFSRVINIDGRHRPYKLDCPNCDNKDLGTPSEIRPENESRLDSGIHFIEPDNQIVPDDCYKQPAESQQSELIFIESGEASPAPSAPLIKTDSLAEKYMEPVQSGKARAPERGDHVQEESGLKQIERLSQKDDGKTKEDLKDDSGQEDKKRKIRQELF